MDEKHGVEASRKALNALLSEIERIVLEKNGKLFERTDRELLAIWGAQAGREDDSENAIRAALDMVDILRKLGMLVMDTVEWACGSRNTKGFT